MGMAQAALRTMALLEPNLIMPQLLERAYSGLEVVNETHRTTAVLSMLSSVALPLVSSRIWQGGQKHLVPLLDLCLPGIDLVSVFIRMGISYRMPYSIFPRRTIRRKQSAQRCLSARRCSTLKSATCPFTRSPEVPSCQTKGLLWTWIRSCP